MDTLDLSFRDLKAVDLVARLQHFGRAAESLGIAQPSLSAQVSKVERALGVTLFERSTRRFLITADGARLLPLLRAALDHHHNLLAAAHPKTLRPAPLQIGLIPTLGAYFAPILLNAAGASRIDITISEEPTAILLSKLQDGELDAALLSIPIRHESIASIPLFDEPFRLLVPQGHDLMRLRPLSPAALDASHMVLLSEGHCLRDQALSICSRRGSPSPRLVATSLETLKYLVAAGEGYTLLPALASHIPRGLRERVELRHFDARCPYRRIGICTRKTLPDRARVNSLAAALRKHTPKDQDLRIIA
ncbi:MAG: LysR family transcriptional regulator [Planctomycetes bacterium]|nr:LysR family transcriptional regulator [Planctomycetota bacterium]